MELQKRGAKRFTLPKIAGKKQLASVALSGVYDTGYILPNGFDRRPYERTFLRGLQGPNQLNLASTSLSMFFPLILH